PLAYVAAGEVLLRVVDRVLDVEDHRVGASQLGSVVLLGPERVDELPTAGMGRGDPDLLPRGSAVVQVGALRHQGLVLERVNLEVRAPDGLLARTGIRASAELEARVQRVLGQ